MIMYVCTHTLYIYIHILQTIQKRIEGFRRRLLLLLLLYYCFDFRGTAKRDRFSDFFCRAVVVPPRSRCFVLFPSLLLNLRGSSRDMGLVSISVCVCICVCVSVHTSTWKIDRWETSLHILNVSSPCSSDLRNQPTGSSSCPKQEMLKIAFPMEVKCIAHQMQGKGELCCISDAKKVKTLYLWCNRRWKRCISDARDEFFVYENQERLNVVGKSIIKTKIDVRPRHIRSKKDENVVYAYQK